MMGRYICALVCCALPALRQAPFSIMPILDHVARQPELSYNVSPFQFSMLPGMFAYATGITSDFSINQDPRCTHIHPKPSLKKRLLCLAGIFGLLSTSITQPDTAGTFFKKELPIAKNGLLANIGPNGAKSSGAKVCVRVAPDTAYAYPPSVWDCDWEPEYQRSELFVHLGPRLVACVQSYCRSIYFGTRFLAPGSDHQLHYC
jgi:hypothetical protein